MIQDMDIKSENRKYMDDLKLYGKNDKELDGPIDI